MRLGALAAGAGAAALVVVARLTGLLEGVEAVILAVLLVLAVPTSRLLARRVLYSTGLCAGLIPALWWWDLPLGPLGRMGTVLALLAGGLTAAALWRGPGAAGGRIRAALPARRRVDLVVVATGLVATVAAWPWLGVTNGAGALARLLPGWDNSAHVSMVLGLRRNGVITLFAGGAPAGETWKFVEYPQGFHAMIAGVVELLNGAAPGPLDQEVLAYVRALGLLMVLIAVLIAAGLAQLGVANRRPWRTAVMTAGAVSLYIAGPGADSIAHGFGNFVLTAALTAGALLVAIPLPRLMLPVPMAALAGFVVGIAHGWVLMLLIALPAVLLVLIPPGGRRTSRLNWRGTRRDVTLTVAAVLAAAAGVALAARIVLVLDPEEVLSIPGGFVMPPTGLLLAVVTTAFAAALWPGARRPARIPWTAAVPVFGTLVLAVVGASQLAGGGALSYYFWKLTFGLVLVSVVVLAVGVLWGPPGTPWPRGFVGTTTGLAATAAVAVAVTQVFGLTVGPAPASAHDVRAGANLLSAAQASADVPGPVLHVTSDDLHPVNRQQWFLALRGAWTVEANTAASVLLDANGFPRPVPDSLVEVLADPDGPIIAVPAADLAELAPGADTDRVISW